MYLNYIKLTDLTKRIYSIQRPYRRISFVQVETNNNKNKLERIISQQTKNNKLKKNELDDMIIKINVSVFA